MRDQTKPPDQQSEKPDAGDREKPRQRMRGPLLRRRHAIQALLIAYGAANALLYATLLPLWEGFDEPFHYSYV